MANVKLLVDIEANSAKLVSEVQKANKSLSGISKSAENVQKSLSLIKADSIINLGMRAYQAARQISGLVSDVVMTGARFETLGIVMRVVGNNVGYTGNQMEEFAKSLEETGISALSARQVLTRMAQAEIDLTLATKLGRVAQDAAVIGQMNSSQALEDMIYGIQSANIRVLRTIGINVQFEESYEKVAKATGRAKESFSEAEKALIRTNVVLEAGEKIAGTYEAAMTTAGKQLYSLQRHLENVKVLLGTAFTPALAEIVESLTRGLIDLNGELSKDGKRAIEEWGIAFRITLIDIEIGIMKVAMFLDKVGGTLTSVQMLLTGPGAALGIESSKKRFEDAANANINYEKRYNETAKAITEALKRQIDLERSLTTAEKNKRKAVLDAQEVKRLAAFAGARGKEVAPVDLKDYFNTQKDYYNSVSKAAEQYEKISWGLFRSEHDISEGITKIRVEENQILRDELKPTVESILRAWENVVAENENIFQYGQAINKTWQEGEEYIPVDKLREMNIELAKVKAAASDWIKMGGFEMFGYEGVAPGGLPKMIEKLEESEAIIKSIGSEMSNVWASNMANIIRGTESMSEKVKMFFQSIGDVFVSTVSKMISQWLLLGSVTGEKGGWGSKGGGWGGILGTVIGLFAKAEGGILPGSFTPIKQFAAGGIADRPTLGLIGEGGESEAVVPLKGGSIPVEMSGEGKKDGGTVIIVLPHNYDKSFSEMIQRNPGAVITEILKNARKGGAMKDIVRSMG